MKRETSNHNLSYTCVCVCVCAHTLLNFSTMLIEFGRRDAFKEKLLDFATKIFFKFSLIFHKLILSFASLTDHICRKGLHVQFKHNYRRRVRSPPYV